MAERNRVWAVAVLAAAAVLFGVRLGDRAVVSEEVRWAEVAREMRATGDYLHPTLNDHTYYDKPVGSYWLIVAASHLTGEVDETAARLPAAVAGWTGVLLVMLLGRRLYDPPTGVLAGAVLATAWGFAFYSRRATADAETVTGVLAAVYLYAVNRDRPAAPWVVGLWLLMAATSLTKGLLGFALPGVVLAVHGTWAGLADADGISLQERLVGVVRGNRWLLNRWTLVAAPVGVMAYLLPFVLSVWHTGATDGLAMVWRENVRRFVNPHNHAGPVYLYLGVIWVLAAPWAVFLPAAVVPPPRPARTDGDRLARALFWAVFVFFTLSASRRSYYLLPVLPGVALLVARTLAAPAESLRPVARTLRAVGWVAFGAAVIGAGAVLVPPAWLSGPYSRLPELPALWMFAAGWLVGLVALGWAVRSQRRLPGVATAVVAAGLGYTFGVALPAADGLRTRKAFTAEVRQLTAPDPDRLAVYHARDAVFDLGRLAPDYPTSDALADAVRTGRVRWVLARRRYAEAAHLPARVAAAEPVQPWEGADQAADKLVLLDAAGP
ncbi:MAG: glycosyltransferase family 39 protein [Gemmataceae bacterium]